MTPIELHLIHDVLLAALREDVGSGDLTSRATIAEDARANAQYTTKQALAVGGLPVVQEIVRLADPELSFEPVARDGAWVEQGTVLARLSGSARSILVVERVTLNLLQRACGIATLTRQFTERVRGTNARIVDTRKTAPGLRTLDKYAVRCGGGMNHRAGLFDGVLIKNNHLAFHASIRDALGEARRNLGHLCKLELEVRRPQDVAEAIEAGADVILLDNLTPEQTREAVLLAHGRVPLESSGGITLDNVRAYAEAGVDYISVGALTHSAPAADIHLRVTPL
jgi:nicotinate-nucleotide pyrophosphorylase (carboxylating)